MGIRFAAQLIDGIVTFACYMIVGRLVAGAFGGITADGFELHGWPAVLLMAVTMLISLSYFTLLEGLWQGQTLGKKLLRLQVVRQDAKPMDLATSLTRNILRLVDGLFGYLVAAILIWRSPLKQRLGDRVAKTLVVKRAK